MDVLYNYPEFVNDIKEAFEDLIIEFDLNFEQIYEGRYILKGKYTVLVFNYDRGDIFCEIRPLVDEPIIKRTKIFGLFETKSTTHKETYNTIGCSIYGVFRYIYPSDSFLEGKERIYNPKLQLVESAKLISAKLRHIMGGDFSWLPGYLEKTDHTDKLLKYVLSNLNYEHPIKKKFWSGDITWERDVEDHLKENQITL
jgi:hypothetical protein